MTVRGFFKEAIKNNRNKIKNNYQPESDRNKTDTCKLSKLTEKTEERGKVNGYIDQSKEIKPEKQNHE